MKIPRLRRQNRMRLRNQKGQPIDYNVYPLDIIENKEIPLTELKPGEEATITRIEEKGYGFERLRELGLSDGAPIRMVKYAPLGDPLEIKIRGFYLSLRKALASQIWVKRRFRGRRFEER